MGWILLFILPKGVFIPIFHAMYRAMAKTDEQDAIDAIWLAEYQRQHGDGGEPVVVHRFKPRSPKPSGPREAGRKARIPS